MTESSRIVVKQVRSAIGYDRRQRATLRGLGLRKLNHTVEVQDSPAVRGMIEKVRHLITVLEG